MFSIISDTQNSSTLPSQIDVLPGISVVVGKMSPFFISMVPGISMLVRILRSVTVIKKEQNELKFLIKKHKIKKWCKRIKSCLWYKTATVC